MIIHSASWITVSRDTGDIAPVFRRAFAAQKPVAKATLEITALGVYEAELNGRRVGDFVLAPGWTSYASRLQVQTYDVTSLLASGENDLRVTVGRGWFRSRMPGWFDDPDVRARQAQPCGLIAALAVEYADGTEETLVTDESWQWAESPVRYSEIYDGETCDARIIPGDCPCGRKHRRIDRSAVVILLQIYHADEAAAELQVNIDLHDTNYFLGGAVSPYRRYAASGTLSRFRGFMQTVEADYLAGVPIDWANFIASLNSRLGYLQHFREASATGKILATAPKICNLLDFAPNYTKATFNTKYYEQVSLFRAA